MYNRQTICEHGIILWSEGSKSSSGRGSTGIILKQERGRTEKSLYHFSFYLFYDKLFLFLFVTITHWFPLHKTNQAVCHRTKLLIWRQFTTNRAHNIFLVGCLSEQNHQFESHSQPLYTRRFRTFSFLSWFKLPIWEQFRTNIHLIPHCCLCHRVLEGF